MTYPANNGSVLSPTPQFADKQITPQSNIAKQKTFQDSILNGSIVLETTTVTGITLSFSGQVDGTRLRAGMYALTYTASGTLLSIGGGATVNVGSNGTYTLVAPSGRQITAVSVGASLPVGNQSDNIVINKGIGKTSAMITSNNVPEAKTVFVSNVSNYGQGNPPQFSGAATGTGGNYEYIKGNVDKVTSQPVNVTGVTLNFVGLTDQQILEIGTHALAFTASGTLLKIGGGATQNVGAGGTFTLVSPSGTEVKAVVVAASIPGGDQSDTITVTDYATAGSRVIKDDGFKTSLDSVYAAL